MSNARSTAASRQRAKFAESPDEARLVDAANLTGEHDRVEPAAALARTDERLVRIESRPRARGHRSNDGGGSRAVRIIVLYDDRRPGLADLRTHRGVPDLSAAWTRYRRRRTGHVSASTAAHSAASRRSRSRFTRPSSSRSFRSRVRVRPRASSRITWSMNRLRFPLFVTRSSSSTVALGSVMLRRPYARVDAFMRIIPMLHTTDVDPHDPCCRHAVAPTLPRLLRWLLVDGPDPANVAKRAESARAACPRGAGGSRGSSRCSPVTWRAGRPWEAVGFDAEVATLRAHAHDCAEPGRADATRLGSSSHRSRRCSETSSTLQIGPI